MTGFEIKFKGKTIYASIDEGTVFVNVWYCERHLNLDIRGFNKLNIFTWYSDNIDDVDEIVLKVVDVAQNSKLVRRNSTDLDVEPELERDLKYYNDLKQKLQKEGLI